ncbi:diguanylate cyclase [Kinneretia asaccharophila]|uniref:PAS domain S-box-containing protein/diguanylate cyclase (GGDEF)-like protein n=1 Tax=Roseateles asaccharophilus TaxID=582607 RepID=A0A4R6N7V4_9BURK|nr:PAS domain-containing protein [Roseateles asaccharophilus]MDN3545095.1 diguanylate cyclase [Roseateles asaccharophilus]TDP11518.1 PAS domain S-box-containing protein/diguanylate cyclase (GGDEF)-like protein [Roseateles asaccharophilus]
MAQEVGQEHQPSTSSRAWRPHLRLQDAGRYIALGLSLLMMWGVVAWFVLVYPQRLLDDQRRELDAAAVTAATQLESVLRDAESNLRTLDLWLLTRAPDAPLRDASLAQLAETLRSSSREIVDVMVGDEQGRFYRLPTLDAQSFVQLPPAQLGALRERAHADHVLQIGEPLRLQPGAPLKLPLFMRMSAHQGELGLLLAVIDHDRLVSLLKPYARGELGALGLLRSDGLGLLRYPMLEGYIGRSMYDTVPGSRERLSGAHGSFVSRGGASDGLERRVSFRSLDDYGLKLLLAQGRDAAQIQHRQHSQLLFFASLLITLLAVVITVMLDRLQRQARDREAMLAAMSDALPLGLFRCDASGALRYANESYRRLHDIQGALQGWDWLKLVPEAQREGVRQRWQARMSQRECDSLSARVLLPDGQRRRFQIHTAPLIVGGRQDGVVGTVEDVTERELQQEAQLTLHAIFEQTPDCIAQFDARGRMVYLNPAGRLRLGLEAQAVLPEHDYRSFLPDPEKRARDFLAALPEQAMAQGHWQGRSTVLDHEGQLVPVSCTVLVHRDARQQVRMVSVLLRDVSEQVLAQQERERSEATLKAVAEEVPLMIAVLDRQQRLLFCNRAYEQQFNMQREDWIGRSVQEMLGPEEYERALPQIEAALAGQTLTLERSADFQQRRLLQVRYAPLQLDDGQIAGMVWVARDITEERAEQARLLDASQTDPLTQLLNRAGFEQRALDALERARQRQRLCCLIYMDLDRFKAVNDLHGHPVGDALLQAVAGRLRHVLRQQDLVARLGGDEFAVLLPEIPSVANAESVAAKLLQAVARPYLIDTLSLDIGVSLGFCVCAGPSADLARMVTQADAWLYEAKRAGRGRYRGGLMEG